MTEAMKVPNESNTSRDWTFSITIGPWGKPGIGHFRALGVRRLSLGFIAFAIVRGDLLDFAARTGDSAKQIMKEGRYHFGGSGDA